jgi:hypothetical protein
MFSFDLIFFLNGRDEGGERLARDDISQPSSPRAHIGRCGLRRQARMILDKILR